MSFTCAKKVKKKNEIFDRSTSVDKETFWTPQKTSGVRLRRVQTPLFVHLWCAHELCSITNACAGLL